MLCYAVKINNILTYAFSAGLIEQHLIETELGGTEHVTRLDLTPEYNDLVDFLTQDDFILLNAEDDSTPMQIRYPHCDRSGLLWQLNAASKQQDSYVIVQSTSSNIILTPRQASVLAKSLETTGKDEELRWVSEHADKLAAYYGAQYSKYTRTYGRA